MAVKNVHQTPQDLIKNTEELTDLSCSHSIQGYDVMIWYKQSDSNELQILGYLNMHFKNPEQSLKNKISLDGNGENTGKITFKSLLPNDSAVYYCAVRRHSVSSPFFPVQKLLSLILNMCINSVHTPAIQLLESIL